MTDSDDRPALTLMEAQALKDQLFERAKFGEITGAEADAEAERVGLGRLSKSPDPDNFDPDRETHWTLVMVVAWIAWRSKDKVRSVWQPWRKEWWEWIWRRWRVGFDGDIQEGWFLEQWEERSTLALLGIGAALERARDGSEPEMSIVDATEALLIALREGFFEASGIPINGGARVPIPPLAWHELRAYEGRGRIDEVRFSSMGDGYRDVLVPSLPVRRFWMPSKEKPLSLPTTMPPHGDGYMPLYFAAQWIATEGGKMPIDPEEPETWRAAYDALISAIASEKVRVVGTRDGSRESVPGHHFADCEVEYPYCDPPAEILWDETLHLRSYPYIDDEHWRRGFDDALVNNFTARWSRLIVAKEDVRERWPFLPDTAQEAERQTGLPGRPMKSRHLIEDEMRRRAEDGRLAATLAAEAEALRAWLRMAHPDHPPPTATTIANNIRNEYRLLKTTK